MKVINLDQQIFVPIVDETNGGATYDMQMTVGKFLNKFCEEFMPEVVEAVPVEWLKERHRKCCEDADTDLIDAITVLLNEYHVQQKEQEEQDV